MGLDMYLYGKVYHSVKFDARDEDRRGDEILKYLGYDGKYTYEGGGALVEIPLAYWRKANAIHGYFVNIQRERLKETLFGRSWHRVCSDEELPQYEEILNRVANKFSDDCQPIYLDREDLENLLNICKQITEPSESDTELTKFWTIEKVKELLPTKGGFFFGGTDYDEYYFYDIRDTQKKLEKIFADFPEESGIDFYYKASW